MQLYSEYTAGLRRDSLGRKIPDEPVDPRVVLVAHRSPEPDGMIVVADHDRGDTPRAELGEATLGLSDQRPTDPAATDGGSTASR